MEMRVMTHQTDYQVEIRAYDTAETWKPVDACVRAGSTVPTVILFSGKVGFTIDQLEQLVTDLKELEKQ